MSLGIQQVSRRGLGAAALAAAASAVVGPQIVGAGRADAAVKQLPRGGTRLFPTYRLVGYSGCPGAPGQGRLGIGRLEDRVVEMQRRAALFAAGRRILPVMELIAVTAQRSPGADGMYRARISDAKINTWLAMAVKHKAMLLLNIQPGRADFLPELKHFEKYLKRPDVGVALDPEWAVDRGQVPGRVIGHTDAAELNACGAYLSQLVTRNGLPEKPMVFHEIFGKEVRNESAMVAHAGVVVIKSFDGIGSRAAKTGGYNRVMAARRSFVHPGMKLFFQEDVATSHHLMTPAETLALRPQPEYVLYE